MKRSKFLKLTAGSMVATTFMGFPAFSRSHRQETSFADIFATQVRDDNLHKIYVKIDLDDDPSLNKRIIVQYVKNVNSNNIICEYSYKKKSEPTSLSNYIRYDVVLSGRPECGTKDDINTLDVDELDKMIDDVLKTISYIDFKPRDNSHSNSRYKEARLLDQNRETLYRLDHLRTDEEENCFLTTACVQHKGLPDDCYELQKLREFRDTYMQDHPEGKELIADYYILAPAIVSEMNKEPSDAIYNFIYNELVLKCINMIEENKPELAMYYYKSFTEELSRKVLN